MSVHHESMDEGRDAANERAVGHLLGATPVLVDVRPAIEVVPGFHQSLILTSGAPLPWNEYTGGQRRAILGAALFEGLATDEAQAEQMLADGRIELGACHDHGCVGSVTGVYSASMPVLVVANEAGGTAGFCTVYEGSQRQRLTYGVWSPDVKKNLEFVRDTIGPALGEAVRAAGGVDLAQVMRRAIRMGDDLHSRNTAASSLFLKELVATLVGPAMTDRSAAVAVSDYLIANDLFFLHVGMAAAKATADAVHGVAGSSIVTAMTMSETELSIRVSGLGDEWFRAPMPPFLGGYFEGYGADDQANMGGESLIMETIGFGGLSSAAAFALKDYSLGSAELMVENTRSMYEITVTKNEQFMIPYLAEGVPAGIDIFKVAETGIEPTIHAGAGHKLGGQIGAGIYRAPLACFTAAVARYAEVYG